MDAEKHVLVDFTGANIKEKWVDYLVVKLLKMDHCDLEELQDKHWEQVAIGHTIMAGKCSASSVKACYVCPLYPSCVSISSSNIL